jgi:hypothetical protein
MANTLICRIDLSKEEGLVVLVESEDGANRQSVTLDGESIAMVVSGAAGETRIFQDASDVQIKCKTFTLEAESIDCVSQQTSKFESGSELQLVSRGSLDLETNANLALRALGNVKVTTPAGQLDFETGGIATLKGAMTNVKGLVSLG